MSNQLGNAAAISAQKYKSDPNLADAELFGNLKKDLGDNPRGIGRNLIKGALTGLEYGSKLKASDKFNKEMEYIQSVSEDATRQLQDIQKEEFAMKKVRPYAMAYIDSAGDMDPMGRRVALGDVVEQYSQAMGKDFKLISIDGLNPFKITLSSSGKERTVDIRYLLSGDAANEQAMAAKMPENIIKEQRKREIEDQEYNLKKQKLDAEIEFMPEKQQLQRDKLAETARRNDLTGNRQDVKINETIGKKIDANKRFLRDAPRIRDLVKNNPGMFNSVTQAYFAAQNGDPSVLQNLQKKSVESKNPQLATAISELYKYISRMALDVMEGFARQNMYIEKIGTQAVPNFGMTEDAFLNVLETMVGDAQDSLKNNLERMKILEANKDKSLSGQYNDSTASVRGTEQDFSDLES